MRNRKPKPLLSSTSQTFNQTPMLMYRIQSPSLSLLPSSAPSSSLFFSSPVKTKFPKMPSEIAQITTKIHLHDLPEALLQQIFSFIEPTRARNSASLVCRRWRDLERRTRSSLSLRGNPFTIPYPPSPFPSFPSLSSFDLSNLSPWGRPLSNTPLLVGPTLPNKFPGVNSLKLYSRDPTALISLTHHWPKLKRVKLVRWHNRPSGAGITIGSDLHPLFENCGEIEEIDLNEFYCWTEDVTEAIRSYPLVAKGLTGLDLMLANATDGFRASELVSISEVCPNLQRLVAPCVFNPRYMDFVNDETLRKLATNCPHLTTLHLVDPTPVNLNNNPGAVNNLPEDNPLGITPACLETLFSSLPLTDFSLDLSHPILEVAPALEALGQRRASPLVKNLKLGYFQGVCKGKWLHLDGVAVCGGLESLCLKNCADLSDASLSAIARGCTRLSRFELIGCDLVTELGIQKLAIGLRQTLKDLSVSRCPLISAPALVKALKPVRDRLERLHLDCIWTRSKAENGAEHDPLDDNNDLNGLCEPQSKRRRHEYEEDLEGFGATGTVNGGCSQWPDESWECLRELSLWLPAGEFLSPLLKIGLEDCPNLSSITIKVEGNCRAKPDPHPFGLRCLLNFPELSKMKLDLGEAIGYAFTAPFGHMDLSLWERFYLHGIGDLPFLQELDYWPPQDREVNQRSLSLPATGLIQMCFSLRKLFIHGTAHEHFMRFFLQMPNLRDVQLREDYYPAPENDMSTEMRDESCGRFELALNSRQVPD